MEVGTSNCSPGSWDLDQQGRSWPYDELWESGESPVLSEPQCLHLSHGTTVLYLQGWWSVWPSSGT